ncbi:hypothetical protein PIB30_005610 [Stylosanthes scabra]|uniref:RNase H type-1 domain-containing protein n=1 Tax=Stylosanthes scabra TaxID=79078 RepID=A0ABU6S3G1_9FABA|nr:hypothetical protein [Stylosanthes scabra]
MGMEKHLKRYKHFEEVWEIVNRGCEIIDILKDRWILGYNRKVVAKKEGIWTVSDILKEDRSWIYAKSGNFLMKRVLVSQSANQARKVQRNITWQPPLSGWIKCNIDASFLLGSYKVQAIKSGTIITEIDAILQDIWELKESIPNCGFLWVSREGNKLVHEIAKHATTNALSSSWRYNPPFSIRNLILAEAGVCSRIGLVVVEDQYFWLSKWAKPVGPARLSV